MRDSQLHVVDMLCISCISMFKQFLIAWHKIQRSLVTLVLFSCCTSLGALDRHTSGSQLGI